MEKTKGKKNMCYTEQKLKCMEMKSRGKKWKIQGILESHVIDGVKTTYLECKKTKLKNPFEITKTSKSSDNFKILILENMKLKIENERLKKGYNGNEIYKIKNRFKHEYHIIEILANEFSVKALCDEIKVSRSGYYKWLERKGTLNSHQLRQKRIINEISKIHLAHRTWGYRRIAQEIRNKTGWKLSDGLCHRCCKSMNIKSYVRKRSKIKKEIKQTIYKNLVNSDWNTNRPFEKVCTDTTSFYNNGKKYDLTMYIDVFNNEIVAYNISNSDNDYTLNNHLVAMKNLIRNKIKRGYNELSTIVHSDQGYIYTTSAFEMVHREYNIIRSMNRAATPTDNPIIESLNGWIKDELLNEYNLEQSKDIRKTIRRYINYFNNKRLAFSLKYKSPVQYRNELAVN